MHNELRCCCWLLLLKLKWHQHILKRRLEERIIGAGGGGGVYDAHNWIDFLLAWLCCFNNFYFTTSLYVAWMKSAHLHIYELNEKSRKLEIFTINNSRVCVLLKWFLWSVIWRRCFAIFVRFVIVSHQFDTTRGIGVIWGSCWFLDLGLCHLIHNSLYFYRI